MDRATPHQSRTYKEQQNRILHDINKLQSLLDEKGLYRPNKQTGQSGKEKKKKDKARADRMEHNK